MMTINLEEKLLSKRRGLTTREKMLLDQLEKYNNLSKDRINVLDRIKIRSEDNQVAEALSDRLDDIKQFSKDRVFHVDEIKDLCCSYGLRFLPAELFNGEVDPVLADKIIEFQTTYKTMVKNDNSYIAAPASSFNLQKRPKDPLFFVQLNSEYYYLLHKWGNDISVWRGFLNFFKKTAVRWYSLWFLVFFSLINLFAINFNTDVSYEIINFCFSIVFGATFTLIFFMAAITTIGRRVCSNESIWNDKYR